LWLYVLMGAAGLAGPSEAAGLPRVAIVLSSELLAYQEAVTGFLSEVDCEAEHFNLEGDLSNADRVLSSALSREPDVVFAVGAKAAIACREVPDDVPVVFCMVQEPERYDLPTKNMTGVTNTVDEIQQLHLLLEVKRSISKVAVPYSPEYSAAALQRAQEAARALNLSIIPVPIGSEATAASAVRDRMSEAEAIWFIPDPIVATPAVFDLLLAYSLDKRIPLMTFARSLVRSGALFASYSAPETMGAQAAELVKRVMTHNDAGGITIPPSRQLYSVNLRTARALGIAIPPAVVAQADSVFR
jgi:putative ABC transport system substrate-binding protein